MLAGKLGGVVDNLITGGYGARASQAFGSGNYGQGLLNTAAGVAFGVANVLTLGEGSAAVGAAKGATSLWPAASGGRTVINGLEYTTHALERMQPVGTIIKDGAMFSRGVPPSAVENAVRLGKVTPGNSASEVVRTFENVRVITNPEGTRVISVIKIGN